MKIAFVAGFGPIVRDLPASPAFSRDALGIAVEEGAPDYLTTENLGGVRAFAMWPLAHAAESCFGTDAWPAELPVPQAWLEFDVGSAEEVASAADELRAKGHRLLLDAKEEPWGQTVARVLSPEGILVGISYTPWMHVAAPVE
jgi:catechol 2,3-dioxygenase-like lactoylglutathione lyase family enzyme